MGILNKIIEGLTIKETISYDFIDNQSTTYWPMNSNNGEAYNGLMIKYPYQHHNIYSSTVLNYTNTFADKHNWMFCSAGMLTTEKNNLSKQSAPTIRTINYQNLVIRRNR